MSACLSACLCHISSYVFACIIVCIGRILHDTNAISMSNDIMHTSILFHQLASLLKDAKFEVSTQIVTIPQNRLWLPLKWTSKKDHMQKIALCSQRSRVRAWDLSEFIGISIMLPSVFSQIWKKFFPVEDSHKGFFHKLPFWLQMAPVTTLWSPLVGYVYIREVRG